MSINPNNQTLKKIKKTIYYIVIIALIIISILLPSIFLGLINSKISEITKNLDKETTNHKRVNLAKESGSKAIAEISK